MKYKITMFLWLVIAPWFVFGQHGSLDTSFGDQGNVIHYLGDDIGLADHAIDQGVNGRIATSGIEYGVLIEEAYVRAFLEDGSVDTSFGNGGKKFIDPNGLGPFGPIHVFDDNSILFSTGAGGVIRKLQPNGIGDGSFGNGGSLTLDRPNYIGFSHEVGPDNSVFLIGQRMNPYALAIEKYDSQGNLDTAFGDQGIAHLAVGPFSLLNNNAILVKPNNSVYIHYSRTINNEYVAIILKLFPSGSMDTTFGNNGKLTLAFDSANTARIFLHENNHFLASNYYYDQQSMETVRKTIKFTPEGDIDASFADNGVLMDHSVEIVEQNQRIITNSTFPDFEGGLYPNLFRVFPDGTIDPSFNFEYTYSELRSIVTTYNPQGDFLLSGGDIWYNGPETNLLLAKYKSTPLGIGENARQTAKIYPNPSTGTFVLELPNLTKPVIYSVLDISGKIIKTAWLNDVSTTLDISEVQSGLYFLKVEASTLQLIKE